MDRRARIILAIAAAVVLAVIGYAVWEDEQATDQSSPTSPLADTTGLTPNELEQISEMRSYDDVVDRLGEPVDVDENEIGEVEEATWDVGDGMFLEATFNVRHGCEAFERGLCFAGAPGSVVAATQVDADGNLAP